MYLSKNVNVAILSIAFDNFWGFNENINNMRIISAAELIKQYGANVEVYEGSIKNSEQAFKAKKWVEDKKIDLILSNIATFPEGKTIETLFKDILPPVLLWSRPEDYKEGPLGHNSFCGANYVWGLFHFWGKGCMHIFGSPCDKNEFQILKAQIYLISALKNASNKYIGMIGGGIVPKFYDIGISKENLHRIEKLWGIKFISISFDEFNESIQKISDNAILKYYDSIQSLYRRNECGQEALMKVCQWVLAIKMMSEEMSLGAVGIRCWPEFQQGKFNFWPCATIGLLNREKIPAACEGDLQGTLDMYTGQIISGNSTTLLDIVDWDDQKQIVRVWHCGPTDPDWSDEQGTCLCYHKVDGKDKEGKPAHSQPAVHEMALKEGSTTLFRSVGAMDELFIINGDIIKDSSPLSGSGGWITNLRMNGSKISTSFMRQIMCDKKIAHHFALAKGDIF